MIQLAVSLQGTIQIILYVLGVFFGFSILILAHELGHFLAAKLVGIKVEAFALGFGPALLKRKRGETEYRFNWIPFGGYVKLAGMEGDESNAPQEIEGGFYAASPAPRALVAVAGPLFSALLAIIIFTGLWITGVNVPEYSQTTTIGSLEEGMPAQETGLLMPGDRIISINGNKINEWGEVIESVALTGTDEFVLVIEREGVEKKIEIKSKQDKEIGVYRLGLSPKVNVIVASVGKGTTAEEMGLKAGDEVESLAGETIFNLIDFKKKLKTHMGETIEVSVLRDGQSVALSVLVPALKGGEYPVLGFMPTPGGKLVNVKWSPASSFSKTFRMVYKTLRGLFSGGKGKVQAKALTGPIGIMSFIKSSLVVSFSYFCWFIGFISLNLAIVNLLPIPILDGGHLLFMAIEVVRRKPLKEWVMGWITNVFFVLIISFFLYVTLNDIKRMFWGKEKVEEKQEIDKIQDENGENESEEDTGKPVGPSN